MNTVRKISSRSVLIHVLFMALVTLLLICHSNLLRAQSGAGEREKPSPHSISSKTPHPAKPRQTLPNLEMVLIPAGTFMMGSPDGEGGDDEHPQHRVSIQSFYIGKYEVTQAQWKAIMGTNPSHFKGNNLPVENISWDDAVEFCRRLSQMTGKRYRLPTEAEWEYACRADSSSSTVPVSQLRNIIKQAKATFNAANYNLGKADGTPNQRFVSGVRAFQADRGIPITGQLDNTLNLDPIAWYLKNSGNQPHPVGQKHPNAFGLYDMCGNVWEWCEDGYHDNYHDAPSNGSAWLSIEDSGDKVLRGGSWASSDTNLRSAYRNKDDSGTHDGSTGFRVVVAIRSS